MDKQNKWTVLQISPDWRYDCVGLRRPQGRMVFMNKVWSLSLIRQKRYRICAFTKNNVGDFPSTHLSFCQIHTQVESRQH